MTKKFRGKTCVYCAAAPAETGDHVFARQFFLERRRANLPKVPSCEACNGAKAKLEHYLASVLPFGGRHSDSAEALQSMGERRLAKNVALHSTLRRGMQNVWVRDTDLFAPTIAVPFDGSALVQWAAFVVKGLTWHHWKVLLDATCNVDIIPLTPTGEQYFERFKKMRAGNVVSLQDVGNGTFSYEARQGADNPLISIWWLRIYGGVVLGGDHQAPNESSSIVGAMVGSKSMHRRAALKSQWLTGQRLL